MAAKRKFEPQRVRQDRVLRVGPLQPLHLDGGRGELPRSGGSGGCPARPLSVLVLRAFWRGQPGVRSRCELRSVALLRGRSGPPANRDATAWYGVSQPNQFRRLVRRRAERTPGEKRGRVLP